jgi:uncharacterized membrane protein
MNLHRILARGRAFGRDDGAAIAIIAAVSMTMIACLLALAIDVGSVNNVRRHVQGATDLAAMAAARDIANRGAAVSATLAANDVMPSSTPVVTPGHYAANAGMAVGGRFVAGAEPTNAVRVEVSVSAPVYFGTAILRDDKIIVGAEAVAANTSTAAITLGSGLAALDGGVLNAVIGALVGGQVSLGVMDYEALATGRVSMFKFMDALATDLNLQAGSYADLLKAKPTLPQIFAAVAKSGSPGLSSRARDAITALTTASKAAATPLPLIEMISVGELGYQPIGELGGLGVTASALDLVRAAAFVANQDHQVAIDLGAKVPGLTQMRATLTIGERPQSTPWMAVGPEETEVNTAQFRLRAHIAVGGTGLLSGLSISLPIMVDLASANARITSIDCGLESQLNGVVRVQVKPALADVWLGNPADNAAWSDFSRSPSAVAAEIVRTPIAKVMASAYVVGITNNTASSLNFTWQDIHDGRSKVVSTHDVTSSLTRSLVQNTDLKASLLGIGLVIPPGLTAAVSSAISGAAALADPVLASLLESLGVTVGRAETTVNGIRCDGAVLVQ